MTKTLLEYAKAERAEIEVLTCRDCFLALSFAEAYKVRSVAQLALDTALPPDEIEHVLRVLENGRFILRKSHEDFELTYAGRALVHFYGFHREWPGETPLPRGVETGIIKWIDTKKGCGFIQRKGGDEIYFESNLIRSGPLPPSFEPPSFRTDGKGPHKGNPKGRDY